jgi:hypothetical protein
MTQYVDTIADTLIHPVASGTPTDDAVRHAIATAKAAGMAVALKPHVDSLDGVWRGEIGTKYTTREHGSTGMGWGRTRQRPRPPPLKWRAPAPACSATVGGLVLQLHRVRHPLRGAGPGRGRGVLQRGHGAGFHRVARG